MGRLTRFAFIALLTTAGLVAATSSAQASVQRTGSERFDAVIVASGASGERQVVWSAVVATGVFNGFGRIVEIQNLPGDPENVLRDDLVFAAGAMHLRSEGLDFSIDVNPVTCAVKFTAHQLGTVEGGTGRFVNATGSFNSTLNGRGLAARNPDRSCSQDQALLFEVDAITATGTLTL